MKIYTKKDLDKVLERGCSIPDCKHHHEKMSELFLNQKCHAHAGVEVCYNADGFLKISCKECKDEIAIIAVGE